MLTVTPASSARDLDAVRALCWDYRDFLINVSGTDRDITQTFYPTDKYTALMANIAVEHARPQGIILLARLNGHAVGCGMTHAIDAETSEIKRVFVSDTARGEGVAALICTKLMEQARSDGFTKMVLDTSTSLKAAQQLYLKLGFTPRGPYQPIPETVLHALLFYEKTL